MRIPRSTFTKSALLSLVSFPQHAKVFDNLDTVSEYHKAPEGVTYDENWTVFGKILRGELPAKVLAESSRLLLFEDIRPRARIHALAIPKDFIGSVFNLTTADLPLLYEMKDRAEALLKQHLPSAYETMDYRLCFHVPPFNSVDHLHLHVLAPVSEMNAYYRFVKYNTAARWSVDIDDVLRRLEQGRTAVPYPKPKVSILST